MSTPSELVLLLLRIGFLLILWFFVFGVVYSLRADLFGMNCLLYTSPSPRDLSTSRMPSSA